MDKVVSGEDAAVTYLPHYAVVMPRGLCCRLDLIGAVEYGRCRYAAGQDNTPSGVVGVCPAGDRSVPIDSHDLIDWEYLRHHGVVTMGQKWTTAGCINYIRLMRFRCSMGIW